MSGCKGGVPVKPKSSEAAGCDTEPVSRKSSAARAESGLATSTHSVLTNHQLLRHSQAAAAPVGPVTSLMPSIGSGRQWREPGKMRLAALCQRGGGLLANRQRRRGLRHSRRVAALHLAHASPRCGARTRASQPCKGPAMPNGRCRMHGGAQHRPADAGGAAAHREGPHGAWRLQRRDRADAQAGAGTAGRRRVVTVEARRKPGARQRLGHRHPM
jgi:hypothetical protein